jgi:hypothetical protein
MIVMHTNKKPINIEMKMKSWKGYDKIIPLFQLGIALMTDTLMFGGLDNHELE